MVQSASVAAAILSPGASFRTVSSPRISTPALVSAAAICGTNLVGDGAVDQQRLDRVADAGTLHLGVEDDFFRHGEIGLGVDENGADAVRVLDHRNARLGDHGFDQAVAAARNDQVDEIALAAEEGHERAVGVVDELHRALGQRGAFLQRAR